LRIPLFPTASLLEDWAAFLHIVKNNQRNTP
jgi:hypothetical protein